MRAARKISLVAAGYIGAFLIATLVVAVYVARTDGPDRQTYGAMYGFGDSLLFLAVFAVSAVLPTGAALYLLRPYRRFWVALSSMALAVASTGLASAVVYTVGRAATGTSTLGSLAGFATLRILVAPVCALGFALSGLLAPARAPRMALFAATFIDAAAFAYVAVTWIRLTR